MPGTLVIDNREYVVLPRREYERLIQAKTRPVKERPASEAVLEIIAKSLLDRRVKAGLSQDELARRAGVHTETISRIESGRFRPRRETMARLDNVLGQ